MELRCARGTVLALLEDLGYDVASFSSREIDTFCRQINDMSHMNSEPKTAAVPLKSRSVHNGLRFFSPLSSLHRCRPLCSNMPNNKQTTTRGNSQAQENRPRSSTQPNQAGVEAVWRLLIAALQKAPL